MMMSEREEFGKWYSGYPEGAELTAGDMLDGDGTDALAGWLACAELKDKHIAELEAELVEQAKVLVANVTRQLELEEIIKIKTDTLLEFHATYRKESAENAALKAKFAELEKQEPDAYAVQYTSSLNPYMSESIMRNVDFSKIERMGVSVNIISKQPLYAEPVISDLERYLLEARIDELQFFADSRNYKISPENDIEERITKLRAQLAALGGE